MLRTLKRSGFPSRLEMQYAAASSQPHWTILSVVLICIN
jgi:hypothetical protein